MCTMAYGLMNLITSKVFLTVAAITVRFVQGLGSALTSTLSK